MKKLLCVFSLMFSANIFAGQIDDMRERYHSDFLPKATYVKLSSNGTNEYDHKGRDYAIEGGVITKVGMLVAGYAQETAQHHNYAFVYTLPDTADIDKYDSKKIDLTSIKLGWGIDTDRAQDNSLVQKFGDDYQFKACIGWGRKEGQSDDYQKPGSRKEDNRGMPISFFMRKKNGTLEGLRFSLNHTPYRYHETTFSHDYSGGIKLWEFKKDSRFLGRNSSVAVEIPVNISWDFIGKYNQNRITEYSHTFSCHEDTLGLYATNFYYPDFGQSSLLRRYDFGLRHFFDKWALTGGVIVHDGSTWASVDSVRVKPADSLGLFSELRIQGSTVKDDCVFGVSCFQIKGSDDARTLPFYGLIAPELGTAQDAVKRKTAKIYYHSFQWDLDLIYAQRDDSSTVINDPVHLFTLSTNTWKQDSYKVIFTYRYNGKWIAGVETDFVKSKAQQHYPDIKYNTLLHNRKFSTFNLGLSITRRF